MPDSFQLAVQRAEAAYAGRWSSVSPKERIDAIYRELRAIDAEQAASLRHPEQAFSK